MDKQDKEYIEQQILQLIGQLEQINTGALYLVNYVYASEVSSVLIDAVEKLSDVVQEAKSLASDIQGLLENEK
jgi:DNA uptake protein ComE-like DNA-binding protein